MPSFSEVLYKHASAPKYEAAQILSTPDAPRINILLSATARDETNGVKRKLRTSVSFKNSAQSAEDLSVFTYEEKDDVVMSAANPYVEGERIVFRAADDKNKPGSKKYLVERWGLTSVLQSVDVTESHGEYYPPDGTFGYISFLESRPSRIAYVAEKKADKDEGAAKFKHEDTWGEAFGERKWPVVVVLDFNGGLADLTNGSPTPENKDEDSKTEKSDKVVVLKPEENVACGQPIFSPTAGKLVWVALPTRPMRYGARFCFNRPSYLVESAYDGSEVRKLTTADRHIRSPYLGPNKEIYYLNNPTGGGHDQCTQVSRINLQDLRSTIVIPIVDKPDDEFAGLFTVAIAGIHGDQLLLTSQHRSTKRALKFDLRGSSPRPSTVKSNPETDDSWEIIGCSKGQAVIVRHGLYGEVVVEHHSIDSGSSISFLHREPIDKLADSIQAGVVTYPERPNVESILLLPTNRDGEFFKGHDRPPAIIFPHGGPHVGFATMHDVFLSALAECGIAILLVNYTGSTGFGQEGINNLVGRIGDLDVDDVKFARDHLVSTGVIDKDRIAMMGGSHGGFLTAWMLGKFPDAFKCGVLRNPVINIGTMLGTTDIPDWCYGEFGEQVNYSSPSSIPPELYKKVWDASPISVADNVKVPVLMSLGDKDRRVPNAQGSYYVKYLRGKGLKDVHVYKYPEDGHGLDSADAFKFGMPVIVDFLKEHL